MKYRDLIQFEPILDVIQLRQADDHEYAEKMVSSYVVSDRMADILLNRVLPLLRLDEKLPITSFFVVGNYGTGKSHLMSVLTSILEDSSLLDHLTNPSIAEGYSEVAGKFKVARQETGSVSMPLRDIVFSQLEPQLQKMGVKFHFPAMDKVSNNKDPLLEMMEVFHKKYPDMGLLIALDELLDYLGSRKDQELMLDLSFLREVGEICAQSQLRFIAGIQESLFDSPRFQFATDSIRRVKTRFDQVHIIREDVAYVISQRLLAKTPEQKKKIRKYLEPFASLYETMVEHLDDFIELFPVHPSYLEVFENVTLVEKRDLLKALSQQMKKFLDQDLPEDHPGIISFDSYWDVLVDDPGYRTIPAVGTIQERTKVLQERIQSSLNPPEYRATAQRIIAGLAIHRMTVQDIYSPIGLRPAELRDRLCLYLPIPEKDADFLLTSIVSVLQEISRAVSGQFISHNSENDQYYLDLKKDVDFDALIDQRASSLEPNQLDRYYFDVLARALELTDSSYVPGFRIWQREIPWMGQGVTRPGYFFLGATNERSTAQPPRDFYIHFLAVYGNHKKELGKEVDELYFELSKRDPAFENLLKRYAGAKEMSVLSMGENREQYDRKADSLLKNMVAWLRENVVHGFTIRHQGKELSVGQILSTFHLNIQALTFRDQIFKLASACLTECFQSKYPDYPKFNGMELTQITAPQAASAAIRALAGLPTTAQGRSVLEALGLAVVEGNQVRHQLDQSKYAQYYLKKLKSVENGTVLNRKDIITGSSGAEKDTQFHLELDWLMVVLFALVRQGEINIRTHGQVFDSSNLEDAARMSMDDLIQFSAISLPKPLPEQALKSVYEGLEVPGRWVAERMISEEGIEQLQAAVKQELDRVLHMQVWLQEGPRWWREKILSDAELQSTRKALTDYKEFMEALQRLTTPGNMHHFNFGRGEVLAIMKTRPELIHWLQLKDTLQSLQQLIGYMYDVENSLPKGQTWFASAHTVRAEQIRLVQDKNERFKDTLRSRLVGGLENLKSQYIQDYLALHNSGRLDSKLDEEKRKLTVDPRWIQLRALAASEFLPIMELDKLDKRLKELQSCPGCSANDLQQRYNCPNCNYVPAIEKADKPAAELLATLKIDFNNLHKRWISGLIDNLKGEEPQANITMLKPVDRKTIEDFIKSGSLPEQITQNFISALKDALHGLEKVEITEEDLLLALSQPSMPCTMEEFQRRFQQFVSEVTKDKDLPKVRIQIKW
jgi:hypothetical protein